MLWFLSTIFCSILAVLFLLDFLVKKFTTYNLGKSLPGAYMYPIIGAITFFGRTQSETFEILMNYVKTFRNGFAYWSCGLLVYHIYSAESLEKIVTNPKHIEKSFSYKFLHSLLGNGLLTSTGEKWFERRKLLTPAFHFNILNGFQTTFNDQTGMLLDWIRKNEVNQSEGTHLQKLISRFTLNTICESAMGVKLKKMDELDSYRSQINYIGHLQVERLTLPFYVFDWTYNFFGTGQTEQKLVDEVHRFTGNIISTKRESFLLDHQKRKESKTSDSDNNLYNKKQRYAMLDTLLLAQHQNQQIDAQGIQEEVDTFVFEGFDTTMTAITFILFMIANHDDVQKRLYEDIISVDDKNGYNDLIYLDAVIKESIRLYPPVPFIGRQLGEDTIIDNVKLPVKTQIHVLIYALHRDPRYFPNAEKFDPNRFLDNDCEKRHPFAYVPFSAGQRNCIGQKFAMTELRTVVGGILREFELKPITKVEDIVIISDLILRTKDAIRLKFIPRTKQ